MKKIGKVLDTFSADINSSGLPRPQVTYLELIKEHGIKNDKFAAKDLNKTVMVVGISTYDVAQEFNIDMKLGSLGENIVFDFNPHKYKIGTTFIINGSEIQITEKCTICNHLSVFDKKLPKLVKDCRGLYCRISQSGVINPNDEVYIKE